MLTTTELNKFYPVLHIHNTSNDLEGHIPYTQEAYSALSTLAIRKVHSITRKEHKVIVLDCDNTLWNGVCGELGANGVKVTTAYKKIQQLMVEQKQAGKLLCLCSKNNFDVVNDVFETNTGMVLSMNDIVSSRVNWLPKSENIMSLSQELNLDLDSFIFIDDDPVQCAEVRSRCPQVKTIQLPSNEKEINQFINHVWALDLARTDTKSIDRTSFYKQNQQRSVVEKQALNLDDFIDSLDLKIKFNKLSDNYLPRAAELTFRTNQFNCAGKKFTETELSACIESGHMGGFIVEVSDRYGDYGLVGLCLFEECGSQLVAETFLLSCRAMGRGIEHAMIANLGVFAQENNCSDVLIKFKKTDKNQPALNFLTTLGFLGDTEFLELSTQDAVKVCYQTVTPPVHAPSNEIIRPPDDRQQSIFVDYQNIASNLSNAKDVLKEASLNNRTQNISENYEPPRDEIERKISEIWVNTLNVNRVGLHDDFLNWVEHHFKRQ